LVALEPPKPKFPMVALGCGRVALCEPAQAAMVGATSSRTPVVVDSNERRDMTISFLNRRRVLRRFRSIDHPAHWAA
jgi:hypothetical protein